MRQRTRLLLSALCGLGACLAAFAGISSVRSEAHAAEERVLAEYGGERVSVCVATRSIPSGDTIRDGDVEVREWASSLLPEGARTSLEEVVGEQAASSIPSGVVVADAYFERADDALDVPSGLVAVSVPSQSQLAIGGALKRGDRVDVYVSDSGVTELLISGAQVVDLSTAGEDAGGSLDWVTIAVEPERVVDVLSASAQGSISLTLPGEGAGADGSIEDDGAADDEGGAGDTDRETDDRSAEKDASEESPADGRMDGSSAEPTAEGGSSRSASGGDMDAEGSEGGDEA